MSVDVELVSCILSTRDRPHFVRQLLRCFGRQTYANRELLIADAGDEPVDALCAGVPMARHLRAEAGASYAACLNLAAEHANGTVLQMMDDDDYYAPAFLERSVSELQSADGDNVVAAWDCFLVMLRGEDDLRFSGHGWAAGGTLCFRRALWERPPFREGHADHHFLSETAATIAQIHEPSLYVLYRHGTNNWQDLRGTGVDAYFRSLPPSGSTLRDVVHPDDVPFYEELGHA